MPAEREQQENLDVESSPAARQRKRKNSGIVEHGEGIRVQGDAPFDPYRFQTFEVTPAFRQRVLEAQLPLLEPRDSFLEFPPQSQQRNRLGANDTTLPEIPEGAVAGFSGAVLPPNPASPDLQQTANPILSPTGNLWAPKRGWLVAGALLMVVLGFAGTFLALRGNHGTTNKANLPESSERLPVR